jgi:hypothetical protein
LALFLGAKGVLLQLDKQGTPRRCWFTQPSLQGRQAISPIVTPEAEFQTAAVLATDNSIKGLLFSINWNSVLWLPVLIRKNMTQE